MIALQDPLGQLPPPASTFAPDVDGLFYFLTWISLFFFFLIAGLLCYSAIRWRRKTEDQPPAARTTHNTMLEIVWTVIPTIILMITFAWGWKGNLDQSVAPGNALQYRVTGKQWSWAIQHPDGTVVPNELWVPTNTPVKIIMSSADVLHSFYIPAFRAKRDVLPGRYQMVWFHTLDEVDDYPLFCTEYCGTEHSMMVGTVHVVSPEEYADKPWAKRPEDPVEWGRMLYNGYCVACHTIDGSAKSGGGPTFKGVWGREEELVDGTKITVDEEYVRESIRQPQAKIVKGYDNVVMSPFPAAFIPDEGIDAIIEFFKTLK